MRAHTSANTDQADQTEHVEHASRAHHAEHMGHATCASHASQLPHAADAALIAPSGTLYTCPIYAEIRQPQPGNCPKCGVTLEPVMPALEECEDPDLIYLRRRFWWSLPFSVAMSLSSAPVIFNALRLRGR